MYLSIRPLITNLTCPGDSSLYVEWAQPDTFYHGVDKYNLFIRWVNLPDFDFDTSGEPQLQLSFREYNVDIEIDCMTRTRTAAEETEDWEVKEVVVPPVAKHSVEKVSRYRVVV